AAGSETPVEIRFARLDVTEPRGETGLRDVVAAIGNAATIIVDDFAWRGRRLGRLSAKRAPAGRELALDELRLAGGAHDARGSLTCAAELAECRLKFAIESRDLAATLADFGFRPDVSASRASLSGEVDLMPGSPDPLLASASGRIHLSVADGVTRIGDERPAPFALFTVPALLSGIARPPGMEALDRKSV